MRKTLVRLFLALTLAAGIASYHVPDALAGGNGHGDAHCSGC